jgi:hypothetical protein
MDTDTRVNNKHKSNGYKSRDRKGAVNGATKCKIKPNPLAYFITFSCYGTHLHGHESASVDRSHNQYGAPHLQSDEKRRQLAEEKMNQDQYILDNARARIVLDAIIKLPFIGNGTLWRFMFDLPMCMWSFSPWIILKKS